MKIAQHMEQGSAEWKALRAGKITASRAKDARDVLKGGGPSAKQVAYAAQVAVERLAGESMDDVYETWQMRQGRIEEQAAREFYERDTGHMVDQVPAVMTDDEVFLYSPDGLIGDAGLLEVKCLFGAATIVSVLANGDIAAYRDQCQFGLWITGREWVDLVIWCPAFEHIGLGYRCIRIVRDDDFIDALELDMVRFKRVVDTHVAAIKALPGYHEPAPRPALDDIAA